MPNLDFITDRLATGGDLPPTLDEAVADIVEWEEIGITHVLDNRLEYSDADLVARVSPGIAYLHNGVDDAGGRQPDRWFDTGVAWAREALADPDAKVLVHCHMGINRGPSLAYAVLLDQGWDPVEAIDTLRAARPIAAVGYAEDALDWHHRRNATPDAERADDRRRLSAWRRAHPLDVPRIIRDIRAGEAARRAA